MTDGFYGSITKYEKSAFKFDKIYPNRVAMEENAATDGVFIGRYVLIDYDLEITKGKPQPTDTSDEGSDTPVDENNVVINPKSTRLLNLTKGGEEGSGETTDEKPSNSKIDGDEFGRSWDSTVWQKVFTIVDNKKVFAYRFIADLNAANPVVEVFPAPASADIFTIPQLSTNNKFTIQIPNNWDFVSDNIIIPDRENTVENPGTVLDGKWSYQKEKAAETEDTVRLEEILEDTNHSSYYINENGNITEYTVKGEGDITTDTKKMIMKLPSLTQAISDMWDIVYGKQQPNNNEYTKRNIDTEWNSYNGIRALEEDEYGNILFSTANLNTMAGTINSMHDLMGMIVETNESLDNVINWDEDKIYYINGKFYFKSKIYKQLTTNAIVYNKNTYCYPSLDGYSLDETSRNDGFDGVLLRLLIDFSNLTLGDETDDWSGKIFVKLQLKLKSGYSEITINREQWDHLFLSVNLDSAYSWENRNELEFTVTEDWKTYTEIEENFTLSKSNNQLIINSLAIDITEEDAVYHPIYGIDETLILNSDNNGNLSFIPYKFFIDEECTQPIYLENDFIRANILYCENEIDYKNRWEAKELIGFGRSLSTIHGLILQLSKILPNGDLNSQDCSTIQGSLNFIQNKLKELLGEINSQWLSIKNSIDNEWENLWINFEEEKEQDWITLERRIDEDYREYQEHVLELREVDRSITELNNSITNLNTALENHIGSLDIAVDDDGILKLSLLLNPRE